MKSKLLSLIKKIGIARLLRNQKGQQITVLCLHRVTPERDFFFQPIHPDVFEELVRYCYKYYEVILFSEIEKNTKKPKLIFSFDDGYYDFIEYALPVLTKYGLRCNHNVVNSCLNDNHVIWTQKLNDVFNHLKNNQLTSVPVLEEIGISFKENWLTYYGVVLNKLFELTVLERTQIIDALISSYSIISDYRMMNWDDLKYCAEQGTEIGSHTYNHESLLSVKDVRVLQHEIKSSMEEIEQKLGASVSILSLPNGQYNQEVIEYVKGLSIRFVLLVNDQVNELSSMTSECYLTSRIYLIEEPINEMILRTELFHSKLRKFI